MYRRTSRVSTVLTLWTHTRCSLLFIYRESKNHYQNTPIVPAFLEAPIQRAFRFAPEKSSTTADPFFSMKKKKQKPPGPRELNPLRHTLTNNKSNGPLEPVTAKEQGTWYLSTERRALCRYHVTWLTKATQLLPFIPHFQAIPILPSPLVWQCGGS